MEDWLLAGKDQYLGPGEDPDPPSKPKNKPKWRPLDWRSFLTPDELLTIFTRLPALERRPEWVDPAFVVRLVLGAGLRVSEIPPLWYPDHLRDDGIILVLGGKGGKDRQVKCSPELYLHYRVRLNRLRAAEGPRFPLFPRKPVNGRVYEGPLDVSTLFLWWRKVLDECGIRRLSIHKGRHTYATMELATKRLQPYEVQAQLGHSKLQMTMGCYVHALSEHMYETEAPKWREVAMGGPSERERYLKVVAK
jgi:integrase